MKIVNIFEVVEGSLFSVLFEAEFKTIGHADPNIKVGDIQSHEFKRLFDLWNDPLQLRAFFEEHKKDLEDDYWDGITIDQAINKTRNEAKQLEAILLKVSSRAATSCLA